MFIVKMKHKTIAIYPELTFVVREALSPEDAIQALQGHLDGRYGDLDCDDPPYSQAFDYEAWEVDNEINVIDLRALSYYPPKLPY